MSRRGPRRQIIMSIRFTTAEFRMIEEAAEELDITNSDLVREAVDSYIRPRLVVHKPKRRWWERFLKVA